MFDLRDSLSRGYHYYYYLSAVILYSWRASFFKPEDDPTALHISSISVTDSHREGVLTEETCYLGPSTTTGVVR